MRFTSTFKILTILLIFLSSCQKDIKDQIPAERFDMYKKWLDEYGGPYKNGTKVIQNPDNEILIGKIDWSNLKEYFWEGNYYVDIPFVFNGIQKINDGELLPVTSFTLVMKLNDGKVIEGAIRTTTYNISLINELGEKKVSTIDSYQKFNGEYLNIWQNIDETNNKLYRKKQNENIDIKKITSANELKEKYEVISRSLNSARAIQVCYTDTYITYETHCYYSTEEDELNMYATCTTLPIISYVTTCYEDNGGGGDFPPSEGGGGSNPGSSGPASFEEAIEYNPFALFNNEIPCDLLEKWVNTARHQAPQSSINKLNSIRYTYHASPGTGAPGFPGTDIARVQDLNSAHSSVINLDYFPVTVNQLPIINGQRLTAEQFMNYIRLNINNLVNDLATFTPYNSFGVNDNALWASSNPMNSLINIDIFGPDNGTVIVTKYNSNNSWTFTTVYEPVFGSHPVSGNRDFGYTQNANGSYTFFTRGVDRLTSADATSLNFIASLFGSNVPFTLSDNLWLAFQQNISNFVNQNGGNSTVVESQKYRPDWVKVKKIIDNILPLSALGKNCPE